MIIKEKAAKNYQCPMSNRELDCCGARCMAWVWDDDKGVSYSSQFREGSRKLTSEEEANTPAGQMGMKFILEEPTGYCGLVDHGK